MNWRAMIQPGPVWTGVEGYADERIATLTALCVNPESSDQQIRQAQAGIEEMRLLKAIPRQLEAGAQQRELGAKRRAEY